MLEVQFEEMYRHATADKFNFFELLWAIMLEKQNDLLSNIGLLA